MEKMTTDEKRVVLARNELLETFGDFRWFLRSVTDGRFRRAKRFHRDAVTDWLSRGSWWGEELRDQIARGELGL